MELLHRITAAAVYLHSRVELKPEVGLVLGSGLGDYADTLENPVRVRYSEIPGFPQTSVAGHSGMLVFGTKMGKAVVAMQGRIHFYEGGSMQELTIPIRVMAALGVKTVLLTNAVGGCNPEFAPGDLMLIKDHINFSGTNPLIGANLDAFGPRFPDVSDLYTKALREKIKAAAAEQGKKVQEGVYMMFTGPSYETPAEVRMARILGADAVGMSVVPEAIVAGHSGMQVIGMSCITNMAAGVLDQKLDHSEVVETAARVHDEFHSVVDMILEIV